MLNIMCAQHMSRRDLNELTDTALTTCTGRLFHALTTRIEKNFSLRVVEHLFFVRLSTVLNIFASSANNWMLQFISFGMSLMNSKSSRGPMTLPCGTPDFTSSHVDFFPFTTTLCLRPLMDNLIHSKMSPLIP